MYFFFSEVLQCISKYLENDVLVDTMCNSSSLLLIIIYIQNFRQLTGIFNIEDIQRIKVH